MLSGKTLAGTVAGPQPRPFKTLIRRFRPINGPPVVSAITRLWSLADVRRCRLCSRGECRARPLAQDNEASGVRESPWLCVTVVAGRVGLVEAPLYVAEDTNGN